MSAAETAGRKVRFGVFELDPQTGELRKRGLRIPLQEQPFRVLITLLERPGELVTREDLRKKLWPDDTFVDFDQGLGTAIRKIREALGDSAENPRFVETLPRRGFRFIAPVNGVQASVPQPQRASSHRWPLLWLTATFALVLAAGVTVWWLHTTGPTEPTYVPIPLTSYPGYEWSPTFSPDGNEVAFVWNRPRKEGGNRVFVKLLGADEPVRLTRDEAAEDAPAWSPDGRFIAFVRALPDDRSGVFLVPAPGGSVRKIGEVWSAHDTEPPLLAWHPNGKWIVVSDKYVASEPLALFLLSVETGEKRRLTTPPPGPFARGDVNPAVSPDGRAVVFTRNRHDLFILELSENLNPKSQPRRLTFENHYTASPAWTPDGRAVIFSSGTPHSPTLYKLVFSRPGWHAGQPERLAFAGEGARQPAVSRQGHLAYSRFSIDANIWRLRLNGGRPTGEPPAKLIASTHLDHMPRYSPDGTRIVFASNRSGSQEIWVCNSDGSGTVQLTSFGGSSATTGPRWSRDGRQIFFYSAPLGHFEPFVIGSDGGMPHRLSNNNPSSGQSTVDVEAWSHDGKWLYFDSDHTGEPELYKVSAQGGREIQITRKGGETPQESPDGRFLYYLKDGREFTSLWKVPVEGGDETKVLESVCCDDFAVVDQGIYFVPEPNNSIRFFSFATGSATRIAQLSGLTAYGLSVSPDGKWLLYSQYEDNGADLMLLENFR